ncbi:Smr/MutS family protein [Alsobacter metallidurans]
MPGQAPVVAPPLPEPATPPPPPSEATKASGALVKPKPTPPPIAPLAPLERRLRQRLSRGSHAIEAVIDLHGMRQAEAHDALRGFLHRAQAQGHLVVLVVTGKGGSPSERGGLFEERGVLRRTVPHWLRLPDLRPLVVGFEEAAAHHGGAGALYIRMRRQRGPGAP